MTEDHRMEADSLGEIAVPAEAYWGAQTQRAVANFPISGDTMRRRFIEAMGLIKQAAAMANRDLGHLDDETAEAIVSAAAEVIDGAHDDQFPVDVFQTGSGTSTNMNANEVIANLAAERLGLEVGARAVHPNDHVNFGQSSNDVIPTAMHTSAALAIDEDLIPALETLEAALAEQAAAFDGVVKTGRTHLQDATPVRMGQEFEGYRTQVAKGIERVEDRLPELTELALGGTAVGTGLNTDEAFAETAIGYLSEHTGLAFREADDHFEAQSAHDAMVSSHGAVRTVAGSLNKIANDIRLMASGPRTGLGEIDQPENQPGSSIMPGKINPVVAEAVNQVHKQVVGHDAAIQAGGVRGELELNLYKPMLADNFLRSCELLTNASTVFAERFVAALDADHTHCAWQVERSMALATALNPAIGYDRAAEVAKAALESDQTVREVAIERGYLDEAEADAVLDPVLMTEPGILGDE